jgi:acetolactate synthase-1/2/3 large subunit
MKASDLFVQCLEQEGVEVVFGIPGAETLDLVDSLSRSGIRFVSARQESGAAFMADVYGRVTGRAGVCLASAGAASTNMTTALAGLP